MHDRLVTDEPPPTPWQVDDVELLRRAVGSARHGKGVSNPRWTVVMGVFGLGSPYAARLCRRFGLDPDEMVHR